MNKIPTTRSSKVMYQNKYVNVVIDELSINDQTWEHVYFTKPNKNAVGVIPVDETGVYLVNQYRYPNHKYFWEFPFGMIDVGSNKLETAKNELLEEAGITAEKLTPIGSFVAEPGMSDQETFVYVAEGLSFGKQHVEVNEIGMELKHFTFDEIEASIKNGELTCGFTLSALMLFKNNFR